MFEAFIVGLLSSLSATAVVLGFPYRHCLVPGLRCFLFKRDREVRVSMAALLVLKRDDHFILVKNQYRRESFGPIGGVFKHYAEAKDALEHLHFNPQYRGNGDDDLKNDLRGFILGRSLPGFIRWFMSGKQREIEPLSREIIEELREIGLDGKLGATNPAKFELVRTIYQGPRPIPGVPYLQFRYIQIYKFASDCQLGQELTVLLFDEVGSNENLIAVTGDEIRRRRASTGELIGEHSCYLTGERKMCAEPAPF